MKKNIYIIVSKTNSLIGKLIRIITKFEYNHISVALCADLEPMFSFARFQANNPFRGGFVEESWLRYLYYNKDVAIRIYTMAIEDTRYEKIENTIRDMKQDKKNYKYDFCGLVTKIPRQNKKNCLSFATEVLRIAMQEPRLKFRNIKSICQFLNSYLIEAQVLKVAKKSRFIWGNDLYNKKFKIKNCLDKIVLK